MFEATVIVEYGYWLVLSLSVGITITHTIEEATADEPIWVYLFRIYGCGSVSTTVGLADLIMFAIVQIALGVGFYYFGLHTCGGLLAGIRLGDAVASHWVPWFRGHRPNPGLWSSTLYLLEFAAVTYHLASKELCTA